MFTTAALRSGILVIPDQDYTVPAHVVHAAVGELLNLGFLVDPDSLSKVSGEDLETIISAAREVSGVERDYRMMYPGFPEQVEETDTLTLWVEQILHYWTGGEFRPDVPDLPRAGMPFSDLIRGSKKVRVLRRTAAVDEVIDSLTKSPVALTEADRVLLAAALEGKDIDLVPLILNAPFRENSQAIFLAGEDMSLLEDLVPSVKNSDILLRLVLAAYGQMVGVDASEEFDRAVFQLSNRDAWSVRMGRVPRRVRRSVVSRLGEISGGYRADRLINRKSLWRKVMSALHPYDVGHLSDGSKRALDVIFDKCGYRTLNSEVESLIAAGDGDGAARLLSQENPAGLLRRLVALLRIGSTDVIVSELGKVSGLPVYLLISTYNGVLNADSDDARLGTAKSGSYLTSRTGEKIGEKTIHHVTDCLKEMIREELKKVSPTGSVGVLSDVPVSLSKRDAAVTDRTLRVGEVYTRVDGEVIRIFSDWKNDMSGSGYVDAGLVFLDEDYESVLTPVTWNTATATRDLATYSGDTNVYPGDSAVEMFDLKRSVARKKGARYAVFTLVSYTFPSLRDLDIFAGVMVRDGAQSGAAFEPRTVKSGFLPMSDSTMSVVQMVDLESGEVTWLDASEGAGYHGESISNAAGRVSSVVKAVMQKRMTYGELAALWAQANDVVEVGEPADMDLLDTLL